MLVKTINMAGYSIIRISFYTIFSLHGIEVDTTNSSTTDLNDNQNATTDMSSTLNTSTAISVSESTTTLITEDPDYTLVYIAVSGILLALVELVLLIVLIIRCVRAFRKKDDNVRLNDENNEDGPENPVIAYVNKTFADFAHRIDSVDNRQASTSETKNSSDIVMTETKMIQRQDPGYMDIDINIDILTDRKEDFQRTRKNGVSTDTKDCREPGYIDIDKQTDQKGYFRRTKKTDTKKAHRQDPGYMTIELNRDIPTDRNEDFQRIKKDETEFTNKTCAYVEANTCFIPSTNRSTYSHVNRSEDDRLHIREKTNSYAQQGIKQNTDNYDDTEYDHAVYRRSYEAFGDTKTYSRLSSVLPRQNPFLRVMEEETEISVEGNGIAKTENAYTGPLKERCKTDTTTKDLRLTKKPSCTSDLNSDRHYNYSKVNKVSKREGMQQSSRDEHKDTRKEQKNKKSLDTMPEEGGVGETYCINGTFEVTSEYTSDMKPNIQNAYSEVKIESQRIGHKPKSNCENTGKTEQKDMESTPIDKKPDKKYEYSQVIKKMKNKEDASNVNRHGSYPDSDDRSFIISEY